MKSIGLYLHIPFCRSKCLYCDFCSFPHPTSERMEQYVKAMCSDLTVCSDRCKDYEIDTVYLGGGTPTILSASQLEELLNTVASHYRIAKNAEVTAECNPTTADADTFRRMRAVGFNRLSIGLQSAQKNELKALGRLHSFEDFCRTWEAAQAADFSNLSVDVMFGIPHQTPESFRNTLEKVLSLAPKHLSAYALAIEEGTPFGRRGADALHLPDEEATRRMYLDMTDFLAAHGIRQYEISNFAVPGYESRHNLKYWNTEEYLGFGPAAHSDFMGERFGNASDIEGYLAGRCIENIRERPSVEERMNEYVMLRMRLCDGLDKKAFAKRFGWEAADRFLTAFEAYIQGGFVKKIPNGVAFTPEGMLVSNAILSVVLEFDT